MVAYGWALYFSSYASHYKKNILTTRFPNYIIKSNTDAAQSPAWLTDILEV